MQIKATLVILFILSALLLSNNLNKPFIGIHDHNGARFGNIAKNYIKYWNQAKFGPVEQQNPDGTFDYYTHYPSLLPLTIAGFYKIFGVSEFTTRLVALIASSLMVCFLFLAARNFWNYKIALFSSLFLVATPMFRYFGKNPVHEVFVGVFGMMTFYGISRLMSGNNNKNTYALIFVSSILAALSGWGGYFVVPAVLYSFWKEKTARKLLFLYIFIIAALYMGHFVYTYYLTGSFWGGGLYEALLYRSSQSPQEFGLLELINRIRLWATTLFTTTLLLSLLTFGFTLKDKKISNKVILIFLAIFGGIYPLIFSNATYQHSYFIYNLMPVITIAAALGIYSLAVRYKKESLFPFICILLICAIYFERQSYVEALQKSAQDDMAYKAGLEINSNVKENQTVLIKPAEYFYSRHPFLNYYSERILVAKGTGDWILSVNDGKYSLKKNEQ